MVAIVANISVPDIQLSTADFMGGPVGDYAPGAS
jgi:hypothetical protein